MCRRSIVVLGDSEAAPMVRFFHTHIGLMGRETLCANSSYLSVDLFFFFFSYHGYMKLLQCSFTKIVYSPFRIDFKFLLNEKIKKSLSNIMTTPYVEKRLRNFAVDHS